MEEERFVIMKGKLSALSGREIKSAQYAPFGRRQAPDKKMKINLKVHSSDK